MLVLNLFTLRLGKLTRDSAPRAVLQASPHIGAHPHAVVPIVTIPELDVECSPRPGLRPPWLPWRLAHRYLSGWAMATNQVFVTLLRQRHTL